MTPTNLEELLEYIAKNYELAKSEPFTQHPVGKLVRSLPPKIIGPVLKNEDFLIKGSVGQAVWAEIPWIAIFNKKETDGAREGVYIVYLFSKDIKNLYLTLNQGVDRICTKYGKREGVNRLKTKALSIRTNFKLNDFNLEDFKKDDNIKISNHGFGATYEKSTIFYKKYKANNLPSNKILEDDLKRLANFYNHYLIEENVLTANTDFEEMGRMVEEGKRKLKQHYVRERNSKIIKLAKKRALEKYGELRCKVCGFSFSEHYEEMGKNFIEAHHTKPISQMLSGEKTSLKDIILLCSNCHRMIHIKYPALSVEKLKKIYKK